MSKDWFDDIANMHAKYGFHEKLEELGPDILEELLNFRYNFLKEELSELQKSIDDQNSEEIVDALIDLCVVAIGTLNLFKVDGHLAWDEVHQANMSKEVGIKNGRPNPLGLPDLVKPEDWKKPSHEKNHGKLSEIWETG